MIRSGNYTNSYNKTEAIGNDTNKYSKINSVTLTGTHIDDNGTEVNVNKTIDFTVDWYGTTKAAVSVTNVKNEVDDMEALTFHCPVFPCGAGLPLFYQFMNRNLFL